MKINLNETQPFEFFPGYFGKMIHNAHNTVAIWSITEGSAIPLHHHVHTQIMWMQEGRFWFELDGQEMILEAGDVLCIPSNIPHRGKALTACRITDVFSPEREDYKAKQLAG